jgi:hypothetical protein
MFFFANHNRETCPLCQQSIWQNIIDGAILGAILFIVVFILAVISLFIGGRP